MKQNRNKIVKADSFFRKKDVFLSKIDKKMNLTFGEYIKSLRVSNQLTLIELSDLLGLNFSNLSKIENGKREFDEKRLEKLALIFNLDIEQLKVEYFADQFVRKMYNNNCLSETLIVAQEKMNYLKTKNPK